MQTATIHERLAAEGITPMPTIDPAAIFKAEAVLTALLAGGLPDGLHIETDDAGAPLWLRQDCPNDTFALLSAGNERERTLDAHQLRDLAVKALAMAGLLDVTERRLASSAVGAAA